MKAFSVVTPFNISQTHIVVAKNMAEAEETFKQEYPYTTIEKIELVAEYVQIANSLLHINKEAP